MDLYLDRAVSKSATTVSGVQSVMMPGVMWTLQLLADNWDTLEEVCVM